MFIVVISWKIRLEWMKTGGSGLPPFVESRIIGDATRGAPGAYLIYMDQLDMLGPWSVGRTVSVGSVRYESRWANLMAHLRPVWRNFFSTPSHRIHGAGIYANIWGYLGYIDGKCYHIYIYIYHTWMLWALDLGMPHFLTHLCYRVCCLGVPKYLW